MLHMYGIKNCDTIKKAQAFLTEHNIAFEFHDFKKDNLTKEQITTWLKSIDWKILLNRRGTTWRRLPEDIKENINETKAIQLMLANPSMIKRPVLEANDKLFVGFDEQVYATL